MAEATPRKQVRQWVRERIREEAAIEIPVLYKEMVAHFASQPDFVSAWLAETLMPMAYEETRGLCADTRSGHVVFGDTILSREATGERLKQARPRWNAWLEYVGDRHVRLIDMTRNELLTAATIRRQRGETELRLSELWTELASHIKGRKTVGQVFTPEQIDTLAADLRVDIDVRRQIIIREDLAA